MTNDSEARETSDHDPDDVVDAFENDEDATRRARSDEASDIALAAPGGILIGREQSGPDDEHFDAAHNP